MDRYIWPLRKEPTSPDAVAGPHGQMYKDAGSYYIPEKYKEEVIESRRPVLDGILRGKVKRPTDGDYVEVHMDDQSFEDGGALFTWHGVSIG